MNRRRFLGAVAVFAGGAYVSRAAGLTRQPSKTPSKHPTDNETLNILLDRGEKEHLSGLAMGELVCFMGKAFLGSPYRTGTLECAGDEQLVVNVQQFDCMTFIETCLALARTVKMHGRSPDAFRHELQLIRYRNGEIRGYPSRLHYFTEWVQDNAGKKIIDDCTARLGGEPDRRALDFMSAHRLSYPPLAREEFFAALVATEHQLSRGTRLFIPRSRVGETAAQLRSGDIIGITTSTPGLDCSHTALAIRERDELRLLHAPRPGTQVQISKESLAVYLERSSRRTGILVARPVDPSGL